MSYTKTKYIIGILRQTESETIVFIQSFECQNLTFFDHFFYLFDLTLSSNVKITVTIVFILRHKPPIQHVSHDVHVIFTYGELRWPDLDLNL